MNDSTRPDSLEVEVSDLRKRLTQLEEGVNRELTPNVQVPDTNPNAQVPHSQQKGQS